MTTWLIAGRIGRPHGLDGSFHVTRPRWALLEPGSQLAVGDDERTVERRAGTEAKPIVRLSGMFTPADVDTLKGTDLLCARDAAPPLDEGEFWTEELVGLLVTDGDDPVGVVAEMMPLPSCEVLRVTRLGGDEILVPMVTDAIRRIDVVAGTVDVNLAFLGETA